MVSYSKNISWGKIRELGAASIWFMYTEVGDPIDKQIRSITFKNQTDVDIWLSTEPSPKVGDQPDKLKLAPYSSSTWDITYQKTCKDNPPFIPIGTQFYARCHWLDSPSAGTWVSISCLVAEEGTGA